MRAGTVMVTPPFRTGGSSSQKTPPVRAGNAWTARRSASHWSQKPATAAATHGPSGDQRKADPPGPSPRPPPRFFFGLLFALLRPERIALRAEPVLFQRIVSQLYPTLRTGLRRLDHLRHLLPIRPHRIRIGWQPPPAITPWVREVFHP